MQSEIKDRAAMNRGIKGIGLMSVDSIQALLKDVSGGSVKLAEPMSLHTTFRDLPSAEASILRDRKGKQPSCRRPRDPRSGHTYR